MPTRLLVTGGAGFIGSSFVRLLLGSWRDEEPTYQLVNLDKLTYAGNLENLSSVDHSASYRFYRGAVENVVDVNAAFDLSEECFGGKVNSVVHFAAESHVDRSIEDPGSFVETNVRGTQVLLEVARRRGVGRFIHISTDEVYGTLGAGGCFTEQTPLSPNSPYASSKAGSDLMVRAYHHTYELPCIITRCSNNYGPYQFPEKLLPLMIANALENKPLPVYGDGSNVRDWIYVDDHTRALKAVLDAGRPGEVYNIGARCERTNLQMVKAVLDILNKPESLIRYVPDRPGHDLRYAVDSSKIETELGWFPQMTFDEGLKQTVEWYVQNHEWVERVRSGAYQVYYQRVYDRRTQWLEGAHQAKSSNHPV